MHTRSVHRVSLRSESKLGSDDASAVSVGDANNSRARNGRGPGSGLVYSDSARSCSNAIRTACDITRGQCQPVDPLSNCSVSLPLRALENGCSADIGGFEEQGSLLPCTRESYKMDVQCNTIETTSWTTALMHVARSQPTEFSVRALSEGQKELRSAALLLQVVPGYFWLVMIFSAF